MFHKKITTRVIFSLFFHPQARSLFRFSSIYLIFLSSSSRAFPRCYYCSREPRDITKQWITDKDVRDEKWCYLLFLNFFIHFFFFFLIHLSLDLFRLLMVDKTIWMAQPTQTSRLLPELPFFPLFLSTMMFSASGIVSHPTNEM